MKKHDRSLQVGLDRHSDIGKEMTLRNANERRRLDGQLKDLDYQLHNNLVNMQAEIMELKSSPYGNKRKTSPRLLGAHERAFSAGGQRLSRGDVSLPRQDTHRSRKLANNLVLPEIDVKNSSLVSTSLKTASRIKNNPGSISTSSRNLSSSRGQTFLQIPSPPSLHRPKSLPDLRNAERLSPRTTRRFLVQSPETLDRKQSSSSMAASSSSSDNLDTRVMNFITADKPQKLNSQDETFEHTIPKITTPSMDSDPKIENPEQEIDGVFYNSMMAKATFGGAEDFSERECTPDLTSMGFMDFNNVIDNRLKQSQMEAPGEDEMRKIRYLRWHEKQQKSDIVKEVFES